MSNPLIAAKRSLTNGCLSITFDAEAHGFGPSVPSIRVKALAHITVQEARDLAASLVDLADQADKRAADLAAAAARRRQRREREVAAGGIG